MAVDDRLSDLLVDWEQSRRSGVEPSLEDLCRDTPDLLPVLRESIDCLRATEWMLEPQPSELSVHDADPAAFNDTELPASHLTAQEFAASIFQSGLLSTDEIAELTQRLDASDLPGEAREIASKLVTEGKLTRYQAAVLLKASKDPLLIDNYVILDTLDTGGMGLVFKALHRSMNRVVALKLLPAAMMSARDTVKRFQREVQAAAALKHPNVVAAYDADESDEIAYLVLEYVEGVNLYRLVKDQGPRSLVEGADYVCQAARGLAYLHSRRIIHRDVKPANLILANDGTVKLLDMGLVRFASSEDLSCCEMDQELTQAGIVIGTVAYMSPEQALDTRSADQRSDIYSLGCTLYFLLTGRSLYHEETGMKTLLAHREQPVPSIREFCEEAPVSLDAVFRTMVAKRPADRLQSMEEVIAAVEACVPRLTPSAEPTARRASDSSQSSKTVGPKRIWQSRKWRSGAIATAIAVAVIASVYLAVVLIRIRTNQGTLEFSTNDPNPKVEIINQPEEHPQENQERKTSDAAGRPRRRRQPMETKDIGSLGSEQSEPINVVTATVRKGDFKDYLSALGTVTASQTVTVHPRVDGEITKVLFKEGQIVHSGDPLFEIDERPYRTRSDEERAQVKRDGASLDQAAKALERGRRMEGTQGIPPAELEALVAAVEQTKGAIQKDQARMQDAMLQLDFCHIKAPITGRIGLRIIEKGNVVRAAGSPKLAEIVQVQPIAIVFPVPPNDLYNLQQKFNSGIELIVEALIGSGAGTWATGRLAGIDNETDAQTGTVRAKAIFENTDNRLFPGGSVPVRVLVETRHNVLLVPNAAIRRDGNGEFVFVVKADHTIERRTVIPKGGETECAVKSGLAEGDVVVVEAADRLIDGSRIRTSKDQASKGDREAGTAVAGNSTKSRPPIDGRPAKPGEISALIVPTFVPDPPPAGSNDRVWAEWLFRHFKASRIMTDVGPDLWFSKLDDVPPIDFHITRIEIAGLVPQPRQFPSLRIDSTWRIDATVVRRLAGLPALVGFALVDPIVSVTEPQPGMRVRMPDNVTDDVLQAVGEMTRLTSLQVASLAINDDNLKHLATLTNLTWLDLTGCRNLHGSGLATLRELKKLNALDLSDTGLDDKGLARVAQFSDLRILCLRGTWISSAAISELLPLSHLQDLVLYQCRRIDDEALPAIAKLKSLRHLNIDGTRVTTKAVVRLEEQLPNCHFQLPSDVQQNVDYLKSLKQRGVQSQPYPMVEPSNPNPEISPSPVTSQGKKTNADVPAAAKKATTKKMPSEQELIARMNAEPSDDRAITQWVLAHHGRLLTETPDKEPQIANIADQVLRRLRGLPSPGKDAGNWSDAGDTVPKGDFRVLGIVLDASSERWRNRFNAIARVQPAGAHSDSPPGVLLPEAVVGRLARLSGLRLLNLSDSSCDDTTLKSIGRLQQLEILVLRDTRITDAGLPSLGGLKRLRGLDLSQTGVADQGLMQLARMHLFSQERNEPLPKPWMQSQPPIVWLDATKTTEAGIVAFQKSVPNCDISASHLMGEHFGGSRPETGWSPFPPAPGNSDRKWAEWLFSHLLSCSIRTDVDPETRIIRAEELPPIEFHITRIDFSQQADRGISNASAIPLSTVILRRLADLDHLESLTLVPADREWLPAVARLTHLKSLTIESGNWLHIGDESLKPIGTMTNLTSLRIESNRLTDAGLKELAGLTKLDDLEITGARYLHGGGLKELTGLKKLKFLNLADCGIDDAALVAIAQLQSIETLELKGTWISPGGLNTLAAMPHLYALDLSCCRRIDESAFEPLKKFKFLGNVWVGKSRISLQFLNRTPPLPHCNVLWNVDMAAERNRERAAAAGFPGGA